MIKPTKAPMCMVMTLITAKNLFNFNFLSSHNTKGILINESIKAMVKYKNKVLILLKNHNNNHATNTTAIAFKIPLAI